MIAALFVDPKGIYSGRPDVECWGLPDRDAREYAGPYPVVAHPPCERWGRYWYGGPMLHKLGRRLPKGSDAGCFAAALTAVRNFGGILEHPEASAAFDWFGIGRPASGGGWSAADAFGGYVCCIEQGHYGHRARKKTWLYAVGTNLPDLIWGKSSAGVRLDQGFHSKEERRRAQRYGTLRAVGDKRMHRNECAATPPAFADLLIFITAPSWFKAREQLTGKDREQAVCVSREDAPEAADVIAVGERWRALEGEWSDDWSEEVEEQSE